MRGKISLRLWSVEEERADDSHSEQNVVVRDSNSAN